MQVSKWLYFAASWIFVAAQNTYDDSPNQETQNYQFRYYVRDESTGDIKSQEETKQGNTVNGHYSVGEPTGDLRVVTYTADEGGFRADVKYEEGGSPASEDKARQTNSKSGVEFHWLPANLDDIQEGKTGTENVDKEDALSDGFSEVNQTSAERPTTDMSDQTSDSKSEETTTESNPSTETSSELSIIEDSEIEKEKISDENDSSSENISVESSSEFSNTTSETPLFSSDATIESTIASTESAAGNSLEISTISFEGKNTIQTDEENKPSTENEQSAEAAESAPLSEEILPPSQPSQMYLPIISYQNLPFLNLPMLENTPSYDEKPPAIIYASQNFYNPWQWFGSSRRVARDVHHIHQKTQTAANGFQLN